MLTLKQRFLGVGSLARGLLLLVATTLALASVIIFAPAKADAATLYSKLNYGDVVYTATGSSPNHVKWYSPASSGPSWTITDTFYTTTGTVPNIMQVKFASSTTYSCSSFVSYNQSRSGGVLTPTGSYFVVGSGISGGTDLGDGVCQFNLSGISAGTNLANFQWASGNGDGSVAALLGSALNGGYSGNDSNGNNQAGGPAFQLCNTSCDQSFIPVPPPDTSTRFIEVFPSNGTTTPDLTFDISGTYYYNPDDFACPWWKRLYTVCASPEFLNVTVTNLEKGDRQAFQFPLSVGESSFSTTTSFENSGLTEVLYDFGGTPFSGVSPYFDPDSFDFGISTTTRFVVVSSEIPFLDFSSSGIVPGTIRFSTTTTPGQISSACSAGENAAICWLGDRLQDVLTYLFFPNASSDSKSWSSVFTPIARKPPFGYITSVVSVLSQATTTATSTLTFSFVSIFAPVTAIIDPLFATVFAIAFLFYIFHRFRHFEF